MNSALQSLIHSEINKLMIKFISHTLKINRINFHYFFLIPNTFGPRLCSLACAEAVFKIP